jgi:hypothetical protein
MSRQWIMFVLVLPWYYVFWFSTMFFRASIFFFFHYSFLEKTSLGTIGRSNNLKVFWIKDSSQDSQYWRWWPVLEENNMSILVVCHVLVYKARLCKIYIELSPRRPCHIDKRRQLMYFLEFFSFIASHVLH